MIGITAGVIAVFVGLLLLVFHLQYPREFAFYFGCTPPRRRPVLILRDDAVVVTLNKGFTTTPTKVANDDIRTVLGRAPGDLRV
jgi:hypothetical protein